MNTAPLPIVLHPDAVPYDLKCAICSNLPCDPVQTPSDNRIYCRSCAISEPNIRQESARHLDDASRRLWENIAVTCSNDGCGWSGLVGSYPSHCEGCCCRCLERTPSDLSAQELRDLYLQDTLLMDLQCILDEAATEAARGGLRRMPRRNAIAAPPIVDAKVMEARRKRRKARQIVPVTGNDGQQQTKQRRSLSDSKILVPKVENFCDHDSMTMLMHTSTGALDLESSSSSCEIIPRRLSAKAA